MRSVMIVVKHSVKFGVQGSFKNSSMIRTFEVCLKTKGHVGFASSLTDFGQLIYQNDCTNCIITHRYGTYSI